MNIKIIMSKKNKLTIFAFTNLA